MQRPLDPLRFKQNRYERPNQKWVCGRAAEGHGCPLGPDERGNCRASGECSPAKRGDRWQCTRNEAEGGKCEHGPLPDGTCAHLIPPCQPVPSLRRSRGALAWLIVALTIGSGLILFGGSWNHRWTDPGNLTNAHATSAAKCSDCHASAAGSAAATGAAVVPVSNPRLTNSALCLNCHDLGAQPFSPHGVTARRLQASTQRVREAAHDGDQTPLMLKATHVLNKGLAHSDQLACATCHQEHHGRNFQLQHLSDTQCQTCHSVQFASFQQGHPEFANYPYRGRTPIFFDHASHLRQHFNEMKEHAPKSCQDCHAPDSAGRFMQVKSFANTCAACHEPQIQGAGMSVKGAAFFTVPGIDVETLASKGISVGEWPKFADGKVTPYQEVLLGREPATRDALEKLRGLDLLDLSKASPEQLAGAEQLAWGVKKLLFRLVVDGQSYLQEQLAGKIEPAGIEIPHAAIVAAQQEWMPHLLTEVPNYQHGVKPPLPEKASPKPAAAPAPNEKPASGDDDLSALVEASPTPAKPAPADDSLGGDDLTAEVAATPSPSPAAAGNDDLSGGDLLAGGADEKTAAAPGTPSPAPTPEAKAPAEWVAAGGWFRPAESFTLYYRPTGHADPFLSAWLNTAAQLADKSAPPAAHAAFRQMADPQAVGLCLKCHSVKTTEGVTKINWLPAEAQPHKKSFTTFRHTTHLSLFGNTACETCHTINPKAEPAKFFRGETGALADRDPTQFQSNFSPLSKTLCLECHQPKIAGDSCLLCHRYHAGAATEQVAGRNTLRPLLGEK